MNSTYFQQLLDYTTALEQRGIEIYEHHYFSLAFGSWTLIAGKRHERIRFDWDGRDAFLTISETTFSDARSTQEWKKIQQMGINTKDREQIWHAIIDFLTTKFAT